MTPLLKSSICRFAKSGRRGGGGLEGNCLPPIVYFCYPRRYSPDWIQLIIIVTSIGHRGIPSAHGHLQYSTALNEMPNLKMSSEMNDTGYSNDKLPQVWSNKHIFFGATAFRKMAYFSQRLAIFIVSQNVSGSDPSRRVTFFVIVLLFSPPSSSLSENRKKCVLKQSDNNGWPTTSLSPRSNTKFKTRGLGGMWGAKREGNCASNYGKKVFGKNPVRNFTNVLRAPIAFSPIENSLLYSPFRRIPRSLRTSARYNSKPRWRVLPSKWRHNPTAMLILPIITLFSALQLKFSLQATRLLYLT